MKTNLLLGLALAGLSVVLVPPAQAAIDPLVVDCDATQWDSDDDGHAETWKTCSTPQCGCYCPVVGAVVQITAAGQDRNAAVWASCQSGFGTSSEGASDSDAVGVRVEPIIYPAALQPILDQILPAIACDPPLC